MVLLSNPFHDRVSSEVKLTYTFVNGRRAIGDGEDDGGGSGDDGGGDDGGGGGLVPLAATPRP